MLSRQTNPEQWLIVARGPDRELWMAIDHLPRGTGILLVSRVADLDLQRLRRVARLRGHTIATEERGWAVRVHSARELTRAGVRRPRMVLISPIYETRTHPDWNPLPLMRAAALARLCRRNAVALGGMNPKRYARLASLGFKGWAGISAFKT